MGPMRWWTSDLHLGHTNIIGYCGRPFADVEAMNAGLVDAWNATVAPDDEVWVLGDVALGRIDDTLALVKALAGRKILLPGNHDRCWTGHRKKTPASAERRRYYEAGFAEIADAPIRATVGGHRVVVHHFPYRGDSRDDDRYAEARPVDSGAWLLHGHVHDRWRQDGRQINVGVDAWNGRPVSDGTLAAMISAGPASIGRFDWEPLSAVRGR